MTNYEMLGSVGMAVEWFSLWTETYSDTGTPLYVFRFFKRSSTVKEPCKFKVIRFDSRNKAE